MPVTNWGWRGITEIATGYVTYMQTQAPCFWPQNPSGHYYYFNIYHDWTYHDSLGAIHNFGGAVSGYSTTPCQGGQFPPYYATFTAPDGSGYTMSAAASPSATVYDRGEDHPRPPSDDVRVGLGGRLERQPDQRER